MPSSSETPEYLLLSYEALFIDLSPSTRLKANPAGLRLAMLAVGHHWRPDNADFGVCPKRLF